MIYSDYFPYGVKFTAVFSNLTSIDPTPARHSVESPGFLDLEECIQGFFLELNCLWKCKKEKCRRNYLFIIHAGGSRGFINRG